MRTARIAVYTLLGLPKQVPDLSPTQYDIRTLLKAARAINNGEPFPGERLLHKLLDNTYFAHVLPPLPEARESRREQIDADLAAVLGRGSQALSSAAERLELFRERLLARWK